MRWDGKDILLQSGSAWGRSARFRAELEGVLPAGAADGGVRASAGLCNVGMPGVPGVPGVPRVSATEASICTCAQNKTHASVKNSLTILLQDTAGRGDARAINARCTTGFHRKHSSHAAMRHRRRNTVHVGQTGTAGGQRHRSHFGGGCPHCAHVAAAGVPPVGAHLAVAAMHLRRSCFSIRKLLSTHARSIR